MMPSCSDDSQAAHLGAGTFAFATMFPEFLMLVVEPATSESKGSEIWRLPSGDRAVGFAEIPADGRAFTLPGFHP
jgi:hypothetical protein